MSPASHNSSTRLDLFVEPIRGGTPKLDSAELHVLALKTTPVDATVQSLRVDVEPELLKFAEAPYAERAGSAELRFESLTIDGRTALLMQCPRGLRVRVNGTPAGRLSVLYEGDQLQLDDAVLHLVEFVEFRAGPPAAEHIGRTCGVCRTSIAKDSRVYVHGCGEILHIEDESTPAERRLECVLVASSCPSCERNISMRSGYREVPEL